jgi:hypothetical protein
VSYNPLQGHVLNELKTSQESLPLKFLITSKSSKLRTKQLELGALGAISGSNYRNDQTEIILLQKY